jgi:AcrR family transcriptional regulator
MRLFAERGYRATTVGQIEKAAGLSARAGAFYRHFRSKQEVFEACLARWADEIRAFQNVVGLVQLDDLRSELTLLVRGALALLERQGELFRFLANNASQWPELTSRVHSELVSAGYDWTVHRFGELLRERGRDDAPAPALAAIALGSIVHYREDEAVYGIPPARAEEDEFADAWVEVWMSYFDPSP